MSTPERFREFEAATVAFQVALTKIGAEVIADLLTIWNNNIDPTRISATFPSWLSKVENIIGERRPQVRDLSISYYRLTRGLATGYTVADPARPDTAVGQTTLRELREEFSGHLDDAGISRTQYPVSAQEAPGYTRIEVDRLPGWDRQSEAEIEADAAQEAVVTLTANGPENLRRKVRVIDRRDSAEQVDSERDDARKKAGSRQAATGERLVRNAARSRLWEMLQRDTRVIGYVRHSLTGTPCGWCAMLISRGLVYRSAKSAEFSDGDLYHDNCKCISLPVYSLEQYESMSVFDLNREYGKLWPEVTKGLSGKDAVSAWRKFIRARNPQEGSSTTQIAQEA